MTIYFFPDKEGPVFLNPVDNDRSMMDCLVADTGGLVNLLEDLTGLSHTGPTFRRRVCDYYSAMKQWVALHPDNILRRSFMLDELGMATQALTWRDDLRMAGWDFATSATGSRLGALAGIEKFFDAPGLPDRLRKVTAILGKEPADRFRQLRIMIPYDRNLMAPALKELLSLLEERGAIVSITDTATNRDNNIGRIRELLFSGDKRKIRLDEKDRTFRIIRFKDRHEEEEYLVHNKSEATLWINSDNKAFDNRLAADGQPTTGSTVVTRSRIVGLMELLISLYRHPVNISNIVEWLSAPYHPLPGRFRYTLAEQIANHGGYLNEVCLDTVSQYIDGKFEYTGKNSDEEDEAASKRREERRRRGREEKLRLYLPYLESEEQPDLMKSLSALSLWARQRIHSLPDDYDKEMLAVQFNELADGIDNLRLVAEEHGTIGLPPEKLMAWSREILAEITLAQHTAKIGARFTVRSPGDIAGPADSIIWVGLEGMTAPRHDCSFLLPGEREELEKKLRFRSAEIEAEARQALELRPFAMATNSLVITYAEEKGGERITRHPLLLRLKEQIENLDQFTEIGNSEPLKTERYERVENVRREPEYHIEGKERVSWPGIMSASSIEALTMHPFDFFFERILRLRPAGMASLPELGTTLGTVAHAVISKFFTGNGTVTEDSKGELEERFERLLDEAKAEYGAILDLPENRIATEYFRLKLRENMERLITVVSTNRLRVVECEACRRGNFGFTDNEEDDLVGYIDMLLEREDGIPVVFDFKWTTGRKFYRDKLRGNRSVQLEIYSALLTGKRETHVPTAYFLMPEGTLVTTEKWLRGENVEVIDTEITDPLMEKIMNSYRYRRDQILKGGTLEANDMGKLELLAYHIDVKSQGLLPLPEQYDNPGIKETNRFSNYGLFKGL